MKSLMNEENIGKSYGHISNSLIVHKALGNSDWRSQGLNSLEVSFEDSHQQALLNSRIRYCKGGSMRLDLWYNFLYIWDFLHNCYNYYTNSKSNNRY